MRRASLSLLLPFLGCAAAPAAPPPKPDPGCQSARHALDRAAEAQREGRLERARRTLAGAAAACPQLAPEAARLEREILDALSGDPDPAVHLARAQEAQHAGDSARAHLEHNRAGHAFETATGAKAEVVYLPNTEVTGEQRYSVLSWPDGPAARPIRLADRLFRQGNTVVRSRKKIAYLVEPNGARDIPLGPYETVHFSPDGKTILACRDDRRALFDARTGARLAESGFPCSGTPIFARPTRLVETSDHLHLTELPSLRRLAEIPIQSASSPVFDRASARLAFLEGSPIHDDAVTVTALDLASGRTLGVWRRPQPAPMHLAISPSGRKLLLVSETAEVIDVDSGARSSLGNRALYPFRKGTWDRNGWGDLITPPAGTGRVAALDDGRACVEQGGSPTLIPSRGGAVTEHCAIGEDGFARTGKIAQTPGMRWLTPAALTDHGRLTVAISADGKKAARVEVPTSDGAPSVAIADAATGRVIARIPLDRAPTSIAFSADGGSLLADLREFFESAPEVQRFDASTGKPISAPPPAPEPADPPRLEVSLDGSLLAVHDQTTLALTAFDLSAQKELFPPVPGVIRFVTGHGGITMVRRDPAGTRLTTYFDGAGDLAETVIPTDYAVSRVVMGKKRVAAFAHQVKNATGPREWIFVFDRQTTALARVALERTGASTPADVTLSPSGHLLALTRGGELEVYTMPRFGKRPWQKAKCRSVRFVSDEVLACDRDLLSIEELTPAGPLAASVVRKGASTRAGVTVRLRDSTTEIDLDLGATPWRASISADERVLFAEHGFVEAFAFGPSPSPRPERLARFAPLSGGGLAVFHARGEIELVGHARSTLDLACSYDGTLAPFEVCAEQRVVYNAAESAR